MKTIDGKNYFNEKSLAEMVQALNNGERIAIYIDCIGHTRTAWETATYVEELQSIFGDKLNEDKETSYTTTYYLAGAKV